MPCDLGQDPLVKCGEAFLIRNVASAHVAMLLARAVLEIRNPIGIFGRVHKVLHQMDCIVEVPSVHVADGKVEFADEFWAKGGDIALQDITQVVMLSPVGGHFRINVPGGWIPDGLRIAVSSDRTEDGLPDAELFRGASVCAHDLFTTNRRLHDGDDFALGVAHFAARHLAEWAFLKESVLVVIDVDELVGAEIDRVRAIAVSAVIEVWIENLGSGSFPTTG